MHKNVNGCTGLHYPLSSGGDVDDMEVGGEGRSSAAVVDGGGVRGASGLCGNTVGRGEGGGVVTDGDHVCGGDARREEGGTKGGCGGVGMVAEGGSGSKRRRGRRREEEGRGGGKRRREEEGNC